TDITRRELLGSAGAAAAALVLDPSIVRAQPNAPRPVVFTNTTVVNPDLVRNDVALAVAGDKIAAIGPSDQVLKQYPNADVYDGRHKALFPGLINCHAHLTATLQRGFNEDFGFPNSMKLPVSPGSLLQGEEAQLMVVIGALEAIRTGTTTFVENAANIGRYAGALSTTGLRWVFAESIRDSENVPGPLTPEGFAKGVTPVFSQKAREEGMQRIADLFTAWHGKNQGRISVFPAAALTETSSPELLRAVREFADKHNLGYTIHLNQSIAEYQFMEKFHGVRPAAYLDRHGFLGPRLFAAHARYVDAAEIALLGKSRTIISHQAGMAANRGVNPPIPALREAGCPIALGTDNNTNDVFEVMRIALLMERIRRTDPFPGVRPQPEDILADATEGGSRAVNQQQTIGSLDVGKKADLFVLDTLKPYLLPHGRLVSAVVHGGHPSDIESVMIDGQFVMRQNKVLTLDEGAILREAAAVSKRIWDKVGPVPIPREKRPPQ
ncbi:MAG TPA: amidohydrolase family protein, partial [Vicinamibacterales bacterium]|nr:amidohydrolase family protein [Vicinamibacterales bacterium]